MSNIKKRIEMLSVKSLYVSFTKEYYTLNDISIDLKQNEKLVVVGSKESGRTALLRTLVGMEPIAKGEVFIKNISLDKVDFENDVSLGYIPSVPAFLDNKNVLENIEYIIKLRTNDKSFIQAKINNALVEFGLDYIKKNPHIYYNMRIIRLIGSLGEKMLFLRRKKKINRYFLALAILLVIGVIRWLEKLLMMKKLQNI